MARNLKADYDSENDILWLHEGRKVSDSLELGKYVIDFSRSEVVGIEIFDASQTLSRLSSTQVSRKMLAGAGSARLAVHTEKGIMFIVVMLALPLQGNREIPIQINAPEKVMMASVRS